MKKTLQFLTSLICFALCSSSLTGAPSYWDSNDTTAGAGATPTGIWGTDTFWSTDSGGAVSTTAWIPGDTAIFSAGLDAVNPFTVTVSGNQTVGGITFESGEGPVTLSGGIITMGVAAFPMVVNANATINSTLAGAALTKTGAGTLTLSGTNAYTGVTTVSAGVLVVGNANALGDTLANTVVSSGAQLQISGTRTLAEPLQLIGNGVSTTGSLRNTADNNNVTGQLMMGTGTTIGQSGRINSDAGTLTLSGSIVASANNFKLTIGGAGDTIIAGGVAYGGTTSQVIKDGAGTLTISASCNYRQSTVINVGTLKAGVNNAFGPGTAFASDMLVTSTLDLNGFNAIIDGLIGVGSVVNTVAGSTLTIGGNNNSAPSHSTTPNFSGALSGGTALTKIGTGTQTLSGNNIYTGDTTISAGKLTLGATGAIGSSANINVAAGATFDVASVSGGFVLGAGQTLKGNGTVAGAVTANGTLAPGTSAGTLNLNSDLTLNTTARLAYELVGNNTAVGGGINDLTIVAGTLTLDGTLNVTELGAGGFLLANAGDKWRLFNYTGGLTDNGLALGTMPALSGGLFFELDPAAPAGQVNLLVSAVPEPSTLVLGLLGGLGLLVVLRRRRLA